MRGRIKFRIGRIVYLSLSRDGSTMGFAFPKDWRNALVEAEPEKFSLPGQSDMRYHWVHVRLAAIDADEMRELVEDAWAFTVPKRVADEYARRICDELQHKPLDRQLLDRFAASVRDGAVRLPA